MRNMDWTKLKEDLVLEMRALYAAGCGCASIARRYKVSRVAADRVTSRASWERVPEESNARDRGLKMLLSSHEDMLTDREKALLGCFKEMAFGKEWA